MELFRRLLTIFLIIIMFVVQGILAFFLPYLIADKSYMKLSESLAVRFGGMNKPKTIVLLIVQIFSLLLCVGVYIFSRNILSTLFIIAVYITVTLILFAYLPRHAAFDLVDYGRTVRPKTSASSDYVSFVGLGDIQFFSDIKERVYNNHLAIKNIHKFMDTYYNRMLGNNGQIMGLITPGDCTQTGQDGRFFTHNEVGFYETRYGLGGKSMLKLPVYECNGNHDYDVVRNNNIVYRKTPPSVQMINRKNKHRAIKGQDRKGNYWWVWDELNFIAINVWPSTDNLLNGKPDGSLEFLRKTIPQIPAGQKFILMTHYVPNVSGWDKKDFFYSDTLVGTPCEPLLSIIRGREQDLVAIVIGHIHNYNTWRRINKDGIQIVILPSPAVQPYAANFALFRYNKKTHELLISEVYDGGEEIIDVRYDTEEYPEDLKLKLDKKALIQWRFERKQQAQQAQEAQQAQIEQQRQLQEEAQKAQTEEGQTPTQEQEQGQVLQEQNTTVSNEDDTYINYYYS